MLWVLAAVVISGCTSAAPPVPTLPPLVIPEVEATATDVPSVEQEPAPDTVPDLDVPARLDEGFLDVFAQYDVDTYAVAAELTTATSSATLRFELAQAPLAVSIRGTNLSGEDLGLISIDGETWLKFGDSPDGSYVAAESFTVDEVFAGGTGVLRALSIDSVHYEDLVLIGLDDYEAAEAVRYEAGNFDWWFDEAGRILGGQGEAEGISYDLRFELGVSVTIDPPETVITREEQLVFLAANDPAVLAFEVEEVAIGLQNVADDVDDLTAVLGESGDRTAYQLGLDGLVPGLLGIVAFDNGYLIVGGGFDGGWLCASVIDGTIGFGAGASIDEVDDLAECDDPAQEPADA